MTAKREGVAQRGALYDAQGEVDSFRKGSRE